MEWNYCLLHHHIPQVQYVAAQPQTQIQYVPAQPQVYIHELYIDMIVYMQKSYAYGLDINIFVYVKKSCIHVMQGCSTPGIHISIVCIYICVY